MIKNLSENTVNDPTSARGTLSIFHIFDGALILKFLKIGIQIFYMCFEIKYHPTIFEKCRIFNIDEHI